MKQKRTAEILRNERQFHGITQEQIAKALGVARAHVNRFERGHTSLSLHCIANYSSHVGTDLRQIRKALLADYADFIKEVIR